MISFFARQPFHLNKPSGFTRQRLSSIVRAQEIADYLGAKMNPIDGFEDDVCIHIKPLYIDRVKDGDYVDVLDDLKTTEKIKKRPLVNVIAMTTPHMEWLRTFLTNKIVHIPHPHMNFERHKRTRKKVTVCGYVGANSPSHRRIAERTRQRLEKEGIKFTPFFTFKSREEIIKFYETIDIQIIPALDHLVEAPHYHEKKIVDAMSFGIPTISGEKLGYRDVDGFYIKVKSLEEMVVEAKKLRDGWDGERLIEKAEEYHISKIAKLYEGLEHTHTS